MENVSTILQGEANESDEEITESHSFMRNTMVDDASPNITFDIQKSAKERISGVVVSGEASESDEDEVYDYQQPIGGRDFPSLSPTYQESAHFTDAVEKVADTQKSKTFRDEYKRPKFKSVFHKRFRENNFHVRCGVVDNTLDTYSYSAEKLLQCRPMAIKTLESAQATLHDLKVAIESLAVVQLNLDSLIGSTNLPRLKKLDEPCKSE